MGVGTDERAITLWVDDDLSRIIVLHDFERWERLAVEREDDGFRIARV